MQLRRFNVIFSELFIMSKILKICRLSAKPHKKSSRMLTILIAILLIWGICGSCGSSMFFKLRSFAEKFIVLRFFAAVLGIGKFSFSKLVSLGFIVFFFSLFLFKLMFLLFGLFFLKSYFIIFSSMVVYIVHLLIFKSGKFLLIEIKYLI